VKSNIKIKQSLWLRVSTCFLPYSIGGLPLEKVFLRTSLYKRSRRNLQKKILDVCGGVEIEGKEN